MSFFRPDDYRYWTLAGMTSAEQVEDAAVEAEKLKGANEDLARYKAFEAEIEASRSKHNPHRLPTDPSALPASSDFDWYKRRNS